MRKEKLPLKSRVVLGVLAGLFNGLALYLWDCFLDEPLIIKRYIYQAVFVGFLMAIIFRNNVKKEKNNVSRF